LLTLLFQGGDVGVYQCPYKCTHCGGTVETEEKLQAHIEKSHTTEQSPYHIKLLSTGSVNCETEPVLPSLELMKPSKLKRQVDKESSHIQDSFIITLNASDGNESDDKHIQFVSVDNIKVEAGETVGYESDDGVQNVHPSSSGQSLLYSTPYPVARVKSYPVNKKLLVERVLPHKEETVVPKDVSVAREEQNVSEVKRVKEECCEGEEDADEIAIECVEESMDCETDAAEEKPDLSIQPVKPLSCSAMSKVDMNCSGKAPGVNICSTENPPYCIVSEVDLNQHTHSKSQLYSSVPSASRQSNDTDVRTNILVEDDTLFYSNMYHMKQYSNIYSDDSYNGRFCQQANTETYCDTSTKQLDICKNVKQQYVRGDSGAAKCRILKTYSRRMLRLDSNATECSFSSAPQLSKSIYEVAGVKKEKSDATARELNE
jgi:hypothetical protein